MLDKEKYIGKRLEGRYEIQDLIGIGGMANVYKAHDVIDDRTVAVKILRDEYLGNEEFLRRFRNESKAIAVLSHPNIVRVYDVSFTGKVHSIVMEYIDGITLKDYIERQSVLTWKEAIHFTLQILRALQHAHDKGIVHRDIKPQNIMLLQNGTIKVTDFGIARFARSEVKTITDRAIGSVHYISPEQAMGEATDEKSDIYSVGVMLFEMLTGSLPFEADSAVSVALKQIQSQAVKPRTINPSIPEGLEDITIRAMQKDAARRYRSSAEMISDIEKFKEDPSIHFQYKYMDTESPAAKSKKLRRAIAQTREEEAMPRRSRTPYIPILTGVTLAFVIVSAAFILMMVHFNNPFARVDDIDVPNLVGLKYETALSTHADVVIDAVEQDYSDEYAKGFIYEQEPRYNGTQIKVGSRIKVKVSLGPRRVTLVDYANQNGQQVMQKMQEDGLNPVEQKEYSDTVPAGSVIYTDPSKGSTLSSGAAVTVYVSMGSRQQLVEVPGDLIGMNIDQAIQFLEFTTLHIGNISDQQSDQPEGTIIAVNPDVGTMQPEGTSLDVVVSKGGSRKVEISVPLPSVSEPITIRARDEDGKVFAAGEGIDTSIDREWRAVIEGEEGAVLTVKIYISTEERGGKLYQEYEVDVDEVTQALVIDRSDHSDFDF